METYICGWKGLPDNLKTKSGLNKMGLETNEESVAQIKIGIKTYNLYDKDKATDRTVTIIEEGKEYKVKYALYKKNIPDNYKTKTELKRMKLEPVKDVVMTILIGENQSIELYNSSETKPLVIKKAICNELGIYECDWESIPNNLKTKGALAKIGLIPISEPIAKVSKNKILYNLYDIRRVIPMKNSKKTDWSYIEKNWNNNPDDYIILNIISTGEDYDDEVIQLSAIDLYGNCLINEYFNAEKDSNQNYLNKHKIGKQFLSKYPTWSQRWEDINRILKDKILIIYNSNLSESMIKQTCKKYSIDEPEFNIIHLNQYISVRYNKLNLEETIEELKYPFDIGNLHNSLIDCFMCLFSLNKNAELFKIKREALEVFKKCCDIKMNRGEKDSYKKGYNWVKTAFKIKNIGMDFKFFDLGLCTKIKESLSK